MNPILVVTLVILYLLVTFIVSIAFNNIILLSYVLASCSVTLYFYNKEQKKKKNMYTITIILALLYSILEVVFMVLQIYNYVDLLVFVSVMLANSLMIIYCGNQRIKDKETYFENRAYFTMLFMIPLSAIASFVTMCMSLYNVFS